MIKIPLKAAKLNSLKIIRFCNILFKSNRNLNKISFDYYKNWHFGNAYLIIDFKFKNAIWFKIGNLKISDFTQPIILDLQHIKKDTVIIEVFGFFQKQLYEINLKKDTKIDTQRFKTKFKNVNAFELKGQNVTTQIPQMVLSTSNPTCFFKKILIMPQNIHLHYTPFKIQDYI